MLQKAASSSSLARIRLASPHTSSAHSLSSLAHTALHEQASYNSIPKYPVPVLNLGSTTTCKICSLPENGCDLCSRGMEVQAFIQPIQVKVLPNVQRKHYSTSSRFGSWSGSGPSFPHTTRPFSTENRFMSSQSTSDDANDHENENENENDNDVEENIGVSFGKVPLSSEPSLFEQAEAAEAAEAAIDRINELSEELEDDDDDLPPSPSPTLESLQIPASTSTPNRNQTDSHNVKYRYRYTTELSGVPTYSAGLGTNWVSSAQFENELEVINLSDISFTDGKHHHPNPTFPGGPNDDDNIDAGDQVRKVSLSDPIPPPNTNTNPNPNPPP